MPPAFSDRRDLRFPRCWCNWFSGRSSVPRPLSQLTMIMWRWNALRKDSATLFSARTTMREHSLAVSSCFLAFAQQFNVLWRTDSKYGVRLCATKILEFDFFINILGWSSINPALLVLFQWVRRQSLANPLLRRKERAECLRGKYCSLFVAPILWPYAALLYIW